jgi:hypothetical protein
MKGQEKILVPLDGSETSEAVRHATKPIFLVRSTL